MNHFLNKFFIIKSRLVLTSLLLIFLHSTAFGFLPNGKMQNYSFNEQTANYSYIISGKVGYVSHVNNIFSAEKSSIKIYDQSVLLPNKLNFKKEILCDELTYELNKSYIICVQGSSYKSIDLKDDKKED